MQQFKVYDLLGREQRIEIEELSDYDYSLNVNQLESGIYFLTIEVRNGNTVSKKIIKY